MSKQKFAFDKTNFILLAVAMAVVIIGFILMTGPVSTPTHFEPDIFSAGMEVNLLDLSLNVKQLE